MEEGIKNTELSNNEMNKKSFYESFYPTKLNLSPSFINLKDSTHKESIKINYEENDEIMFPRHNSDSSMSEMDTNVYQMKSK